MLVIGKDGRETSQITADVNTKGSPVHAHQEVLCEFLVFINTDLILPPQAPSLPSPHLHFLPCLLLLSRRWSLFPKPPYRAQTGLKLKSPCSSCGAVVRRMPTTPWSFPTEQCNRWELRKEISNTKSGSLLLSLSVRGAIPSLLCTHIVKRLFFPSALATWGEDLWMTATV